MTRCTCDATGKNIYCPYHGAEAAKLRAECVALNEALLANIAEGVAIRQHRTAAIVRARELGWTLDDIGVALGMTKARVQQIVATWPVQSGRGQAQEGSRAAAQEPA